MMIFSAQEHSGENSLKSIHENNVSLNPLPAIDTMAS